MRDIVKDETGNISGALTTVAATALAGADLGVPLDGVTFGGASAVAGLIGAGVGGVHFLEDKHGFAEKGASCDFSACDADAASASAR